MPRRRRKIQNIPAEIQPPPRLGVITIERLAHDGRGVGYLDGLTVFVPRTAPGDEVEVRLVDQRRRYAVAELVELRQPSPLRVPPPCPFYDDCGGCHLQHLSYTQQLNLKTTQVRDALTRIGKLPDVPVQPALGSPRTFAYRNKVVYHYDQNHNTLGLINRHHDHILDIPQCRIGDPRSDKIMAQLRLFAAAQPTLAQTLRHVQVQVGQYTDEVLVTVIVNSPLAKPLQRQLWNHLRPHITGLWMHVKLKDTPAVFNGPSTFIAGAESIHERIGPHRFRIEPQAFTQVNSAQMERLYHLVRDAAHLSGKEIVLDLYSGGGAFALLLAPDCAQVHAVEANRQASLIAIEQARLFGIKNCAFHTGKVERVLFRYLTEGIKADVAILDPPRAGCRPDTLRALAMMAVPRIIYISCSPPTLARDLQLLHDSGYHISNVQPLDMFPQTYHIECITILERSQ